MALTLCACLMLPAAASAEAPPFFWKVPENGVSGSTAGRLDNPRGVAANEQSGSVYVAEYNNSRISEFDIFGEFIKAWGWGVLDGSPELQLCTAESGCQAGVAGSSTGQLSGPIGLAVDSLGDIYAVEHLNRRVSKFSPAGEFLLAFGGDVVAFGPGDSVNNEQQQVTVTATGGTFRLKLENPFTGGGTQETTDLPFNASAAEVDAALEALSTVGGLGGSVTVSGGPGNETGSNPYLVTFEGTLGGDNIPTLGTTNNLTGTVKTIAVATTNEGGAPEICEATLDTCKAGSSGTANGQFGNLIVGDYIAVDPIDDTVYVGEKERIQEFEPDGTYIGQLPLPAGKTETKALDAGPGEGELYFAPNESPSHIYKYNGTAWVLFAEVGAPEDEEFGFPVNGTVHALASDSAGNVYAIVQQTTTGKQSWREVVGFGSNGTCLTEMCPTDEFETTIGSDGSSPVTIATSAACDVQSDALYVAHFGSGKSYVNTWGPPPPDPEECGKIKRPPEILDQYAVSVDSDGAVVRARINPKFEGDTTYWVQYGTEACPASNWEGPSCEEHPLPPGTLLGGGEVNTPLQTAGVFLAGLAPGTTYHYRFAAQSSGSEGEPVYGVGGKVGIDGTSATFTTFPEDLTPKICPNNQAFRNGPAAFLPDCRAHERVSPDDKEGGDAVLLGDEQRGHQLNQSSLDGGRFTYSSRRAFGEPEGAPNNSQYLVTRNPKTGWSNAPISSALGVRLLGIVETEDSEYRAFSPDLCTGWLRHDTDHAPFAPDAIEGFANLYKRNVCEEGKSYEAITEIEAPLEEPNTTPGRFLPELQGLSADGDCAVFRANGKLTNDGSPEEINGDGVYQLYESCGGAVRLVSVLPDGSASDLFGSAGTPGGFRDGRNSSVFQTVSDDGSRVYWTASLSFALAGKIYVRDNTDQDQSALGGGSECTEPAKACTYPVSAGDARFWAASASGSRALFTEGGTLREYDFAGKASTSIAGDVSGVVGTSEDLSRIYFISTQALDGAAQVGDQNLYLREGGSETFIAALSSEDGNGGPFSPIATIPINRSSRVSPDGSYAAFMSTSAELAEEVAGYDNTDLESGEEDAEVYLYDAASEELRCVSCNATGARPAGENVGTSVDPLWAAAQLSTWETQLYPERALSEDGQFLFFESFEALVPRDTNSAKDVYEWERAASEEECEELGAELFVEDGAQPRGCLSLISSGKSPIESEFLDATPNGSDAFFATLAGLLPHDDDGLIDVYDARVEGGFPPPPAPDPPCEGEACQSPPAPPEAPTPGSSATARNGNFKDEGSGCGKVAKRARRLAKEARRMERAGEHRKAKHLSRRSKRLARKARQCRLRLG